MNISKVNHIEEINAESKLIHSGKFATQWLACFKDNFPSKIEHQEKWVLHSREVQCKWIIHTCQNLLILGMSSVPEMCS